MQSDFKPNSINQEIVLIMTHRSISGLVSYYSPQR